jgi:hypothetical protein
MGGVITLVAVAGRAKERAAAPVNLTKETPPVRQYVQVNVLPARDNPPPLPPAPDNMVKDAPDDPV